MTPLVEVPLGEGGSILVEVDEPLDGPVVRGRGGGVARLPPLPEPLEEVLAGLGPATRAVVSQLRSVADSPDEVEVEFAVKLTADARLVIVHAGGEANFRVALKWSRAYDSPLPGGDGDEGGACAPSASG